MFAFWNNLSRRALWCEQFLTEVNFRNSLGNQNCAHFLVHPTLVGKLEGALLWLMPSMNSWGARRYLGWELGHSWRAVPLGKRSLVTLIMLFKMITVQFEYLVPFMEAEKTSCGLCWDLELYFIIGSAAIQKIQPWSPSVIWCCYFHSCCSDQQSFIEAQRKSKLGFQLLAIDQTSAADCQWTVRTNVSLLAGF